MASPIAKLAAERAEVPHLLAIPKEGTDGRGDYRAKPVTCPDSLMSVALSRS